MELEHLANGLITFFSNGNPVFNNGPRGLPRHPPDWVILDNWVFGSLYKMLNYSQKLYEDLQLVY